MTILDADGNRRWTSGNNEFNEVYYMALCRSIMKGSQTTHTVWRDVDHVDHWNEDLNIGYVDDISQLQRWYRDCNDIGNLRMFEWQYGLRNRDIFQTRNGYSKLMTGKWFNDNLKNNPKWYGFYSIWTEYNDPNNLGLIDINGVPGYDRQQLIDFLYRRTKIKSLYDCVSDLEVGEKK